MSTDKPVSTKQCMGRGSSLMVSITGVCVAPYMCACGCSSDGYTVSRLLHEGLGTSLRRSRVHITFLTCYASSEVSLSNYVEFHLNTISTQ